MTDILLCSPLLKFILYKLLPRGYLLHNTHIECDRLHE